MQCHVRQTYKQACWSNALGGPPAELARENSCHSSRVVLPVVAKSKSHDACNCLQGEARAGEHARTNQTVLWPGRSGDSLQHVSWSGIAACMHLRTEIRWLLKACMLFCSFAFYAGASSITKASRLLQSFELRVRFGSETCCWRKLCTSRSFKACLDPFGALHTRHVTVCILNQRFCCMYCHSKQWHHLYCRYQQQIDCTLLLSLKACMCCRYSEAQAQYPVQYPFVSVCPS